MNSAEALIEMQRASVAYQIALTRIGAESVVELLALWRRLRPEDTAATAQQWLDDAVLMILSRRRISQDLAIAYYRLARALRTGSTIPDPNDPTPRYVTLDHLRDQFNELAYPDGEVPDEVAEFDPEVRTPIEEPLQPESTVEAEPIPEEGRPDPQEMRREPPAEIDEDRIVIEFDWSTDPELEDIEDLLEELDTQDEYAEESAIERLTDVIESLNRSEAEADQREEKARRSDEDGREARVDKAQAMRQEGRDAAREKAKGITHMVTANGGRGAQEYIYRTDRSVIGYVRVSKTGTPCYFCAALISRGMVYKSLLSAGGGYYDESDRWHDYCKCFAVPIFFWGDYKDSSMFDANRDMWEAWKDMSANRSEWEGPRSSGLLNAWRRYYEANLV